MWTTLLKQRNNSMKLAKWKRKKRHYSTWHVTWTGIFFICSFNSAFIISGFLGIIHYSVRIYTLGCSDVVRILVGGWFHGNFLLGSPVKSIHPKMLSFIISMNYCFILELSNFPPSLNCTCEFSILSLYSRIVTYWWIKVQMHTYFFCHKCSDLLVDGWVSTNPNVVWICKSQKSIRIIGRSLSCPL